MNTTKEEERLSKTWVYSNSNMKKVSVSCRRRIKSELMDLSTASTWNRVLLTSTRIKSTLRIEAPAFKSNQRKTGMTIWWIKLTPKFRNSKQTSKFKRESKNLIHFTHLHSASINLYSAQTSNQSDIKHQWWGILEK